MPELSIIIPTHNRHSSLMELIGSISHYRTPELKPEVIIVSNFKDPFIESLKSHPLAENLNLRILTSNSQGVNKARNLGLQKARGAISFLIDDDCKIIDPKTFAKILDKHRDFPQAVAIGGVYKTDPEAPAIDIAYNLLARAWQVPSVFKDHESSRLVGGCVSYKTGKLLDCGELFNENIQFGGTESEFHRRLNRKGLQTLFFENLHVQHKTRLNTPGLIHKAFHQAKTASQYDIDGGYDEVDLKTYQQKRELWAMKKAKNRKHFRDIIYFIKIYDRVYSITFDILKLMKKFKKQFL